MAAVDNRWLANVQVGDRVVRLVGGDIRMPLRVTAIDEQLIHCGPWKFNRIYGYEVDEDLGWGVPDAKGHIGSGSFLVAEGAV